MAFARGLLMSGWQVTSSRGTARDGYRGHSTGQTERRNPRLLAGTHILLLHLTANFSTGTYVQPREKLFRRGDNLYGCSAV
jgi:hypothetical protein